MNIVSFSTTGGAGNVAKNLAQGFSNLGHETNLVAATTGNLRSNPFRRPLLTASAAVDNYLLRSANWDSLVSLRRDRYSALSSPLPSADMTIFRWMNGLLGKSFLLANSHLENLVWGLDDMNPFTGVCHYSMSCRGFEAGCYRCPALREPFADLALKNLERKTDFANRYNPKYVAPTDWIHREFKSSSLGRKRESEKILNPLSERFFDSYKLEKSNPAELRMLLVAANLDDPTKGVWDVIRPLQEISKDSKLSLTMVGRFSNKLARNLPEVRFMGPLSSQRILEVMNQSDVLLVPSISENAGTVLAEAASQGLPTIARRVGGMPEMTNYGKSGFLFNDSGELSQLVGSVTKKEISIKGQSAKEWAQQLRPTLIAQKYSDCFLK